MMLNIILILFVSSLASKRNPTNESRSGSDDIDKVGDGEENSDNAGEGETDVRLVEVRLEAGGQAGGVAGGGAGVWPPVQLLHL